MSFSIHPGRHASRNTALLQAVIIMQTAMDTTMADTTTAITMVIIMVVTTPITAIISRLRCHREERIIPIILPSVPTSMWSKPEKKNLRVLFFVFLLVEIAGLPVAPCLSHISDLLLSLSLISE